MLDPQIRAILERKFRIHQDQKTKPATNEFNSYVLWQIVFTMCFLFLIILFKAYFSTFQLILSALFILITLINCGAILDHRNWVFHLEYSRLFVVWILMSCFLSASLLLLGMMLFGLVSILSYDRLQQRYLQIVYRRV
jgi:hypothetical protein